MRGILRGIAFKRARRGVVETTAQSHISVASGIAGDRIGKSSKRRQVTVLRAEDWADVVAEIGADLTWTARRANLLIEGLPSFKGRAGQQLRIGNCILHITGETDPCSRMGEIHMALPDALTPQWRGGATCTVIADGDVAVGDDIILLETP
jgi:MOSC domain-containing protein YiiM